VNTYIAAWAAITRGAPWGTTFIHAGLSDPLRAETTASALPRRDGRLVPFIGDFEASIVRLAAGSRSGVIAGVLASLGSPAHAAVERRLVDPKTRGSMCDGIALPEASSDARSLVLAVPPEARDHASCVTLVLEMASEDDKVLEWLATTAEPGLLTAMAKGALPCPRVATIWQRALVARASQAHGALSVPLKLSINRCADALDPVLADLLTRAPRARACILHAIDPFGGELAGLAATCNALRAGTTKGEAPLVRERTRDALAHGCRFVAAPVR
jgi:hypothetical protein